MQEVMKFYFKEGIKNLLDEFSYKVKEYEDNVYDIIVLRNERKELYNTLTQLQRDGILLNDDIELFLDKYKILINQIQNNLDILYNDIKNYNLNIINRCIDEFLCSKEEISINIDEIRDTNKYRMFFNLENNDYICYIIPIDGLHRFLSKIYEDDKKLLYTTCASLSLDELMIDIHKNAKKKLLRIYM